MELSYLAKDKSSCYYLTVPNIERGEIGLRKDVYYQRGAADPILDDNTVLEIVRQFVPNAGMVKYIDETGGEARTYAVDGSVILKVQRPQQLRMSTSLEKEALFLKELEKQTDVRVPRVLGYERRETLEYICMTRIPGIKVEDTKLTKEEKNALLLELGKELRKIHGIDQTPILESGLFPRDEPSDLVDRLQRRYQNEALRKKDNISTEKLNGVLAAIENELKNIRDTDVFTALHVNPYICHVFVDGKTHKYTGLIDFGDSYIGHPIFDMWYWKADSRKTLLRGYTSERPVSAAFQVIFDTVNTISKMVQELCANS